MRQADETPPDGAMIAKRFPEPRERRREVATHGGRSRVTRGAALFLIGQVACGGGAPEPADGGAPRDVLLSAAVDGSDAGRPADAGDAATDGAAVPASGTLVDPIIVETFPFVDRRSTERAPTGVFDRYECALETDQGGGGFVYLVRTTTAGTLHAALDDQGGDAIDVDLNLLSEADASACLVRDDVALSHEIDAAEVYLIADTWVDAQGLARAGPYTLTVDFTPAQREEAPYGTVANPIQVDHFPFVDQRDTRASPSAVLDAYACAPDIDEGGAEFVYAIRVQRAGTLTATLDDRPADDVDIDLQLMATASPSTCLARDNVTVSLAVQQGQYVLSADTWVDGSGDALAGPFELRIDFSPDGPAVDPIGSPSNPIVIDAFPATDRRNTETAPGHAIDRYACAPNTNEAGGEFLYRVEVGEAGVLQVSVDDVSGDDVDIDLHLLGAADPATCLARGDRSVAHPVAAGTYYLAADTWTRSSGRTLPGPYVLDIDLVPSPDFAEPCVILYGDTRGANSTDPQAPHRAVIGAIEARCSPRTLVHSGDHVRSSASSSDWDRFRDVEGSVLGSRDTTFYPTRGNHDGSWSNLTGRLSTFVDPSLSASRYVRELMPGLALLVLDTESDREAQRSWLERQLDDPAYRQHKFVVAFHRPLYPSIGGHRGDADAQTHWMPVFRAHAQRVLVLSGHNHGLSREVVDGVTFVTSGGGGAPLYGCGQAHLQTRFCASAYGYVACNAALDCTVFRVDPAGGPDVIIDAFSVGPR